MKLGIYPRLAFNSIQKNKKLYTPYILTCIGMIMMFYIVCFLANSEITGTLMGASAVMLIMVLGSIVMAVFSMVFLFYTNSFLIKRRKKEFGLYNILGMGKANLSKVLICESLTVGTISILCGLFLGVLFSKLAELLFVNILGGEITFDFKIDFTVIKYTVILFAVIFLLLLINTLKQIKNSQPIELLRSENTGEKPPKANHLFAIAGIVLLITAYAIAVSVQTSIEALLWFFVAVVMVIIATYLLFIAGSVTFCKILQKNKNYYYKTNHFVSVSSMIYRMKRNGAGLASICIICTMVLVMISTTVCLYFGGEDSMQKRYPRNFLITSSSIQLDNLYSSDTELLKETANNTAADYGYTPENILDYSYARFDASIEDNKVMPLITNPSAIQNITTVYIISIDEYNKITGKNETLAENQAMLCPMRFSFKSPTLQLGDNNEYTVTKKLKEFVNNGDAFKQINPVLYIVVPDIEKATAAYSKLADFQGDKLVTFNRVYGYDLPCNYEEQEKIAEVYIDNLLNVEYNKELINCYFECSSIERTEFLELFGGLFFLGILLGIVFIFAAVLIIYYKQVSEGYEDQSRFEIMQKVGMNKTEIKKSINSQVLTVFFIPLAMSAIHVIFAMPLIYKILILLSGTTTLTLILTTLACFAVFALFYITVYVITSKAYYQIVSSK
ncbi:MAG: ABC transporter permease [Eubacterium sp.]|nr:ABC transporter permease [Eubacterium sp.]